MIGLTPKQAKALAFIRQSFAERGVALGSDIIDRGFSGGLTADFLECNHIPNGLRHVVSNPPFKLAEKFVAHALSLATGKVAMLLPANWLQGQKRSRWLQTTPLYRAWFICPRPSMPPGRVIAEGGKPGNGTTDYCWLIWLRNYQGVALSRSAARGGMTEENFMGRPRGSKNKPKDGPRLVTSDGATVGHNSGELSDEQRQALFLKHKRDWESADADVKAAMEKRTAVRKRAKADGFLIEEIKTAIQLETEDGEQSFKDKMERQMRVARWLGLPIGLQGELFESVDRRPAEDKAFEEGKRACFENKQRQPPYDGSTVQYQAWLRGYDAGQETLRSQFKPLNTEGKNGETKPDAFDDALEDDERDLRPPHLQRTEAERAEDMPDIPAGLDRRH